jgi:iron complex transport system ATP-binding protein
MTKPPIILECQNVSVGYSPAELVLRSVNLQIHAGELTALVGPNGAGKSTLFKVLSGYLPPQEGRVLLGGSSLADLSDRERARHLAWLPQELPPATGHTVEEVVLLGRYFNLRGLVNYSADDRRAARVALEQVGIIALRGRRIGELSGGERQRVFLAQALAQGAGLLLLDEPTNHLDLAATGVLITLLRKLTATGRGVLLITHDLNLAARYADRLLLIDRGKIVATGSPAEVIVPELLHEVYGAELTVLPHPLDGSPQVL